MQHRAPMDPMLEKMILEVTGASTIVAEIPIQELWSGYGVISRFKLEGGSRESIIVKHVRFPDHKNHPRGWNTVQSHNRKLKSYEVEAAWYQTWSSRCDRTCRVPECLGTMVRDDEAMIVLEDLDASGFHRRVNTLTLDESKVCLNWLACFHARFLGQLPKELWPIGTYWHLDTRPEELEKLDDVRLKDAASAIDKRLRSSSFQTVVHGDAKLANFCFTKELTAVAAVDFQYVGSGCGMKDVAYFLGSCFSGAECEEYEEELLFSYFLFLKKALAIYQKDIDTDQVEREWRNLFALAWADFHRFLKGWSPGHWKVNNYSEKMTRKALELL